MHGPQGAGKNMFFESIADIYGRYGLVVDQDAIEDKYNSIFSAKLFLIADEVVSRQELYQTKNKLKGFITGDTIRINPKNIAARSERNHVNVVFLSNESQPLVLEDDDRRHMVVWTPAKLEPGFYKYCKSEIDADGIAALHDYLLNLDLGDFAAHTLPPMTKAKRDLIDLGMNSTDRFWLAYSGGHIDGIYPRPIRSEEFGELYRAWCSRNGIKNPAPNHILTGAIGKRRDARKGQARWKPEDPKKTATFIFPLEMLEPPHGTTQAVWLEGCVQATREEIDRYKGSL
jgi:putative DNA primase/helicase